MVEADFYARHLCWILKVDQALGDPPEIEVRYLVGIKPLPIQRGGHMLGNVSDFACIPLRNLEFNPFWELFLMDGFNLASIFLRMNDWNG
ncbi:MAG: hypothetical protein KJT03_23515 [Verrucomicrobiae bacterium]|nr:hypothetical protein [Verrucomicrobiae bacterium]